MPPPLEILSDEKSAAYVARSLILGAASGLERYYWYAWDNLEMGLSRGEGQIVNAAGRAYAETRGWLIGARNLSCATSDKELWLCQAERSDRLVWFVWAVRGPRLWRVPQEVIAARYTTLAGVTASIGPQREVGVAMEPILLD